MGHSFASVSSETLHKDAPSKKIKGHNNKGHSSGTSLISNAAASDSHVNLSLLHKFSFAGQLSLSQYFHLVGSKHCHFQPRPVSADLQSRERRMHRARYFHSGSVEFFVNDDFVDHISRFSGLAPPSPVPRPRQIAEYSASFLPLRFSLINLYIFIQFLRLPLACTNNPPNPLKNHHCSLSTRRSSSTIA